MGKAKVIEQGERLARIHELEKELADVKSELKTARSELEGLKTDLDRLSAPVDATLSLRLRALARKHAVELDEARAFDRRPKRERLPKDVDSKTIHFELFDEEGNSVGGYATVQIYPDGRPGGIFFTINQVGGTERGLLRAYGISVSQMLQYGIPLEEVVRSHLGARFPPAERKIGGATSVLDYVFKKMLAMWPPKGESEVTRTG
jgi:hypothetical protein